MFCHRSLEQHRATCSQLVAVNFNNGVVFIPVTCYRFEKRRRVHTDRDKHLLFPKPRKDPWIDCDPFRPEDPPPRRTAGQEARWLGLSPRQAAAAHPTPSWAATGPRDAAVEPGLLGLGRLRLTQRDGDERLCLCIMRASVLRRVRMWKGVKRNFGRAVLGDRVTVPRIGSVRKRRTLRQGGFDECGAFLLSQHGDAFVAAGSNVIEVPDVRTHSANDKKKIRQRVA